MSEFLAASALRPTILQHSRHLVYSVRCFVRHTNPAQLQSPLTGLLIALHPAPPRSYHCHPPNAPSRYPRCVLPRDVLLRHCCRLHVRLGATEASRDWDMGRSIAVPCLLHRSLSAMQRLAHRQAARGSVRGAAPHAVVPRSPVAFKTARSLQCMAQQQAAAFEPASSAPGVDMLLRATLERLVSVDTPAAAGPADEQVPEQQPQQWQRLEQLLQQEATEGSLLDTHASDDDDEQEQEEDIIGGDDFHALYEMGELLGQGTYGSVYAAAHRATGQQYAVKVLPLTSKEVDKVDAIENEVRPLRAAVPTTSLFVCAACWCCGGWIALSPTLFRSAAFAAVLQGHCLTPRPAANPICVADQAVEQGAGLPLRVAPRQHAPRRRARVHRAGAVHGGRPAAAGGGSGGAARGGGSGRHARRAAGDRGLPRRGHLHGRCEARQLYAGAGEAIGMWLCTRPGAWADAAVAELCHVLGTCLPAAAAKLMHCL